MEGTRKNWEWPDKARFAVSLCYDDGNENNLDLAMPDLEAAGFRGSFYLHLARADVQARAADWRRAHERGHEIGNHSWYHNCRVDLSGGVRPSWVSKPLEEYTGAEMSAEIARAADWIDAQIGPDPDRTFTYPCCHMAIGQPPDQQAYADAVRTRHRFARSVFNGGGVNDPGSIDLMLINSFYFGANTFEEFHGAAAQAMKQGGWACLAFHGIGGPSHTTSRAVHQRLIRWLHEDACCWVAPVRDVARYIEKRRST